MGNYLIWFGIFVFILIVAGFFYTRKEFKVMDKHPEEFRDEPEEESPKVKPD